MNKRLVAWVVPSSAMLLAIALVSPPRIAPMLAGLGLAGLMALRVYAMSIGWPPRAASPASRGRSHIS